MMRDMTFTSDVDFSRVNLIRRNNNDLGNDLGNLLNRVVSMVGRYRDGVVPTAGEPGDLERDVQSWRRRCGRAARAIDRELGTRRCLGCDLDADPARESVSRGAQAVDAGQVTG